MVLIIMAIHLVTRLLINRLWLHTTATAACCKTPLTMSANNYEHAGHVPYVSGGRSSPVGARASGGPVPSGRFRSVDCADVLRSLEKLAPVLTLFTAMNCLCQSVYGMRSMLKSKYQYACDKVISYTYEAGTNRAPYRPLSHRLS